MAQTLSLDDDDRPAAPLFSARTVWLTAGLTAFAFAGFVVAQVTDRSELLMPIDPNLEAAAIGLGVFAGLFLDAVLFTARQGRISVYRLLIAMAVVPVLCAMSATYTARRFVEYRAFHGLPVVTAPADFTVTGVRSGRSGRSLALLGAPGQRTLSLGITSPVYAAAHVGDHIILPVQTGRDGVQRMIPPARAITPGDLLASDGSTGTPPKS